MKSCPSGSQHGWHFPGLRPLFHLHYFMVISWSPALAARVLTGTNFWPWYFYLLAQVALGPGHPRICESQGQCSWHSNRVPDTKTCSEPLGTWGPHLPVTYHEGSSVEDIEGHCSYHRVTEERKPSLEETPTGHLPFQEMMKAFISFQTSHNCPMGQRPSPAFSSSSIQDSQSSLSTFGYDHSLSRCESCSCQRWSLLCQTHVELGSCGRHTLVHLR